MPISGATQKPTLPKMEVLSGSSKLKNIGLAGLSGVKLKTSTSVGAFVNSKQAFQDHIRTEVGKMTKGMEPARAKAFTDVAEKRLGEIMDQTFKGFEDRLAKGKDLKDVSKTMTLANKLAGKMMDEMKGAASAVKAAQVDDAESAKLRSEIKKDVAAARSANVKPELIATDDGYVLQRKAPGIETIVLSGGGAKGLGYTPAFDEFRATGLFDDLKEVIGTSAGALTAVTLACGETSAEMAAHNDIDLIDAMKTKTDLQAVYPDVGFQDAGKLFGKLKGQTLKEGINHEEANQMIKIADEVSAGKVSKFLQNADPKDLAKFATDYAKEHNLPESDVTTRLATLAQDPDFSQSRADKMVTFSDMQMMHALAPQDFKEIQLTGYDMDDKKGVAFSAETSPNLPIAYAARISMAHPLIAQSVTLDPKFNMGTHKFADGGIASNIPTELAHKDMGVATGASKNDSVAAQEKKARTAVMFFDEGGKGYTVLHDTKDARKEGFGTTVMGQVVNNPNMRRDWTNDAEKAYASGPNSFIVFHSDIETTTLKPTFTQMVETQAQSTLKTLEQINNNRSDVYTVTLNSVPQAYNMLTLDEKKLIVADGPPDRKDFTGPRAESNFAAATQFYDRAFSELNPQAPLRGLAST